MAKHTFDFSPLLKTMGPIDEKTHRPQLEFMISAVQKGDGRFSYAGMEDFHSLITAAARVLGGYPGGARAFNGRYSDAIKEIEQDLSRPLEQTLEMISQLRTRICTENPQRLGDLQAVSRAGDWLKTT